MQDKILLFIPGYNCTSQIKRVLEQLDEDVLPYMSRILMVNNQSTDDTEKVVLSFMEENKQIPLTLLRNDDNYGLGGSHKVAFQYAIKHKFNYVIVLHGDDQGSIKDLLPVLKNKVYQRYDCCLGARFMRGSKLQGYSAFRTFGNVVYDLLFAAVVKQRIFDLGSGLNMYSVSMLKNRFYQKFPDNLTFNYCMILAADYYNHHIRFFPISWREDDQISNVKMVSQATKVLQILKSYAVSKEEFIRSELREKSIMEYTASVVSENVTERL